MQLIFPRVKMKLFKIKKDGEVFSDMASLFNVPNTNTAIVGKETTLITIPASSLRELFYKIPEYKARPHIKFLNELTIFHHFDRI
jgi:hypothetical protein